MEKCFDYSIFFKFLPVLREGLSDTAKRSGITSDEAIILILHLENLVQYITLSDDDLHNLTEKGFLLNGKLTGKGSILAKSFQNVKNKIYEEFVNNI